MKINNKRLTQKISTLVGVLALSLITTACATTEGHGQRHEAKSASQNPGYAIGEISQAQLLKGYPVFAKQYQGYVPAQAELSAANNLSEDITLKVFFGSWCHDSEREVPRLLKSFSKANLDIELIGLDTQKQDPQGLAKQFGVKYTPTIIVYKQGVEVGRIIERPELTLAQDIARFTNNL